MSPTKSTTMPKSGQGRILAGDGLSAIDPKRTSPRLICSAAESELSGVDFPLLRLRGHYR